MKKLCFRNCHPLFITILILLFSAQAFGQVSITRDGQEYKEMKEVKKFEMIFLHNEIIELVTEACGTYDPKEFKCPKAQEKGLKLAGLAFIPIWEIEKRNKENYFKTIGIRVVVVLWEPSKNCLSPKVKLASFDKIKDALSHNTLDNTKYFIEKNIEPNSIINFPILSNLSSPDEIASAPDISQLFDNSREFDIVFLPIDTYHYLTNDKENFYNSLTASGPQIEPQGITLRQSLVVANGTYKAKGIQGTERVRSLWFEPFPSPTDYLTIDTRESGTVFRHGIHCPPYWRNDLAESFEEIVCDNSPNDDMNKDRFAIGFFAGRNYLYKNKLNSIDKFFYELTLEYRFKTLGKNSDFSTELQVGKYFISSENKFYGINLFAKYTYNLSNERFKIFAAGGIGISDFLTTTEAGLIGKAGVKFRIAPNTYLGGAVQYQNIDSTNNNFESLNMFGIRSGITLYLR